MAITTWNNSYSLGITMIDSQHQRLFALVDQLHEAMKTGKGADVQGGVLAELVTYTRTHFAAEERLLTQHAYPELAAHKQQHEQFTRKIQDFSDKARTGKLALTVTLSAFLKEWLTGHIMQVDRKYATYLQEKAVV